MSIVIPIDMPKTCRECIDMKIPVQCRVIKQEPVTAVMVGYNRPKDCPLKELPPHGDLGDISELYVDILADLQTSKIQTLQDVLKILKVHFNNAPVILKANYKQD